MNEFKLKMIFAVLASIVFSFIFIILALILPAKEEEITYIKKPKNILEEVSKSLKK